jgi:hypothetical protein
MHVERELLNNLKHDRNILAAGLSAIPGLGHIYKGYYAEGAVILLLGAPLCVWAGLLLSLATAGVGLLLPLAVWVLVGTDAYFKKNHRRHHWLGVL